MSITISPKSTASPVRGSVIGATGGKRIISAETEMERRRREQVGVVDGKVAAQQTKLVIAKMLSATGRPLYAGNAALLDLLSQHIAFIAGNKGFKTGAGEPVQAARFGPIGHLARRLPAPVLLDNEEVLAGLFGPDPSAWTMAMDASGRMWVAAPFYVECVKSDSKGQQQSLPVFVHEYLHAFLRHSVRMRSYDPRIANWAMDAAINPMAKKLFPAGTTFSQMFETAWGNRPEDARFKDLPEETIGDIMQSEAAEALQSKGVIKIKQLEIVDGPVSSQTVLAPKKDEVLEIDHLVVTVEELFDQHGSSVDDRVDHDFDARLIEIEQTINRLKPRHRPSSGGGNEKKKSAVVEIPTTGSQSPSNDNSDNDPSQDANQPPAQGEAGGQETAQEPAPNMQGPRSVKPDPIDKMVDGGGNPLNSQDGHVLDLERVKQVLRETGYQKALDATAPETHSEERMAQTIEAAINASQSERLRVGAAYPGAHITDYLREKVKPQLAYRVSWEQQVKELIAGAGPRIGRSMEERSILSMMDPSDMGMEDDEIPELPGIMPFKPEGRIAVIVDSSGSMDTARLMRALAFILGLRASADDMTPDIDLISADTSLRGEPINVDEDALAEGMESGLPIFGRGGTEILAPLTQLVERAEAENIKYDAILYITDLGLVPPKAEQIPANLPPLAFLVIPEDYAAFASVRQALEAYADVMVIDKDMHLSMDTAEARSHNRGTALSC